jgi:cytosine/uracil/thiamine/allantoin permease
MAKIVRHEFLGNWIYLCVLLILLLPIGVVYWMTRSIRIEEEMESPEEFVEQFRAGKLTNRT